MKKQPKYAALPVAPPPHPPTDQCPDLECWECGKRDCPFHEPLHYHHDGCPACSEFWPTIDASLKQSLAVIIPADRQWYEMYRSLIYQATDNLVRDLAEKGYLHAGKEEVAKDGPG